MIYCSSLTASRFLILYRSFGAHPESPAGGSRGGSALSQPAHSDQTMSGEALLHLAAEWLVSVHCRGMSCTCSIFCIYKGRLFAPWGVLSFCFSSPLGFLCINFLLNMCSLEWRHWTATFLKGTPWSCNSWQCTFLRTMKMFRLHAQFLVLCCNKGMLMVWLGLGLVGVREMLCFCLNTAEHCPNSWSPVWTTY